MKPLLPLLFLFYNSLVLAQNSSIDSAHNFLQNYKYQEALNILHHITDNQYDVKLKILKGNAYKGLFRYTDAIKEFENVLKIDTIHYQSIIELANLHKQLGNYAQSLLYFNKAYKLRSANATIIEQANIYFLLENYKKALKLYLSVYQKDTSNVLLSSNIARCYDNLDVSDSAILFFNQTLLSYPSDYQSTYRLINLYINTKQYANGIEIADNFRKQGNVNEKVNRMSAYLYLMNKKYTPAIERFKECIARNDTDKFIQKFIGISYYRSAIYDTAVIYLQNAFRKDTTDATVCYLLGLSCAQSYYKELGIKYIQKAIKLTEPAPDYLSNMYQNLADACIGFYKYKDAFNALKKAQELTPSDTILIFKFAENYESLGDRDNAIKYYSDFLKTRKPASNKIQKPIGVMTISYYDLAEQRLEWLKKHRTKNGKIETIEKKDN
jgi:tetratricopeptide (TPR) repeat protein